MFTDLVQVIIDGYQGQFRKEKQKEFEISSALFIFSFDFHCFSNFKSFFNVLSLLFQNKTSFERKTVNQTTHENLNVIIQKKFINEKENWTTKKHCILPKLFLTFIAQLSDKSLQSSCGGLITSVAIIPFSVLSVPLHPHNNF